MYNLFDTPASSLMDSIVSPKVKTSKKKKLGCFLARSTLGYKGVLELQDGTRKIDKHFTYSHKLTQTKQQVG
jgi:hypothetical protein